MLAAFMFVDQVGSLRERHAVGDEVADETRLLVERLSSEAVSATGGRVVKGTGDGLLAVFPTASSAVRAGMWLLRWIERRERHGLTAPGVKVGVAVGECDDEGSDVHGFAVSLAARVCDAAGSGELMVDPVAREVVRHRLEGIDVADVLVKLKGLTGPISLGRVSWPRGPYGDPPPLPATLAEEPQPRMVGRQRLVDEVASELTGSWLAHAHLHGPPGVGASRLAREVAVRLHAEGRVIVHARCRSRETTLGPLVAAFAEFVPGRARHERDALAGPRAELLVRFEATSGVGEPGAGSASEASVSLVVDATLDWLASIADHFAVTLVLDDAHLCDPETRTVIAAIAAGRLPNVNLLTTSQLDVEHALSSPPGQRTRSFEVAGLGPDDVVALAAELGRELDGEAAVRLLRLTGGLPLHLIEVLRSGDGGEHGLSTSVVELLAHRVDELGPDCVAVADALAVEAGPLERGVLAEVAEIGRAATDRAVAALSEAGLVHTPRPDVADLRHELVADAIRRSIDPARRAATHRRLAGAIAQLVPDGADRAIRLVRHHEAVDDDERAFEQLLQAARGRARSLSHRESALLLRRALEVMSPGVGPGARVELMIELGAAERRAGLAQHRTTLRSAFDEAVAAGAPTAAALAVLASNRGLYSRIGHVDHERIQVVEHALDLDPPDRSIRARLMAVLAAELTFSPLRRAEIAPLTDRALELARASDEATLVSVLGLRQIAGWSVHTLDERIAESAEMARIASFIDDPRTQFWSAAVNALVAGEAGLPDAVPAQLSAARDAASRLRQASLDWYLTHIEAAHALFVGDLDRAEHLAMEALALGFTSQQPDAETLGYSQLAAVLRAQGRVDEVLSAAEHQHLSGSDHPRSRMLLADLLVEAGRLDQVVDDWRSLRQFDLSSLPHDVLWADTVVRAARVAEVLEDEEALGTARALLEPFVGRSYFLDTWVRVELGRSRLGWHGAPSDTLGRGHPDPRSEDEEQ